MGKVLGHYNVIFNGSKLLVGQVFFVTASRSHSSGWVVRSSQKPLTVNTQHSQETDICTPGGIRTHNPSKKEGADPRLRPRNNWNRHFTLDHDPLQVISELSFMSLSCHLCRCYITYTVGVLLTFMGSTIIHSVNKTSLSTACVKVKCNSASYTIRCFSKHLGKAPNLAKWH